MTFDSLLGKETYRILKGSKFVLDYYQKQYRYICVDEAQDTSKIQHMIINLLAKADGNIFMVGDEDQSIYGFRAAYPDALLNFKKDHPGAKVLYMDKNYRSNSKIIQAADIFIQHNKDRYEKHICATREGTSDINFVQIKRDNQYNYLLKVAANIQNQTAILYRDNESILPLVDLLERQSLPYTIKNVDMAFFTNKVVLDILNILQFAFVPMDEEIFMKIYFKFQSYLSKQNAIDMCRIAERNRSSILEAAELININGRVLGNCRSLDTHFKNMVNEDPYKALIRIEKYMGYGEYMTSNNLDKNKLFILKMLAKQEPNIPSFINRLYELRQILSEKQNEKREKLVLATIHSSKGLEYDSVILMDVINGVFPNKVIRKNSRASAQEKKDFEEERRIFYVGMTRAKEKLTIFQYLNKQSIFIKELGQESEDKEEKKEVRETPKKSYTTAASSYLNRMRKQS